jgi:type IV pilus assembly protein PilY1
VKEVLLDLLCVAEPKGIRFGLSIFRDPEDTPALEDPNGGYVSIDIGRPNPNYAANLEAHLKNTKATTWTPLAESLFQLYTYFMPRVAADLPDGLNGQPFPRYNYERGSNGRVASSASKETPDPVTASCQKNFVIIVTDGLSTRDDFDTDPAATSQGFGTFAGLIGDYHADGETEDPGAWAEGTSYLDDIAKYMNEKDCRPDYTGDQTLDIYTVGFATEPAAEASLAKTAAVGNGTFYSVDTGDQLATALNRALNDIVEKSQSFTAASVPSARTADGGDFYQSYFFPVGSSAFWEGHLRAWHITATGDILDTSGACALADPDPLECNSGPFLASANYFWDAAEEMPLPANRSLSTSKMSVSVPFSAAALTAADLGVLPFAPAPALTPDPNSPLYPLAGSTALGAQGLKDEIIEYVRGCQFGTGVAADVGTPLACAPRPVRLGDIFHSNPVVVRQPSSSAVDPSFQAFRTAYAGRGRVIYAGTNAGFLEAFDAGAWDTSATPPQYTPGTGVEKFGFMPWQVRNQIKDLAIDSPTARTYHVDGSPQTADVWLQSAANDPTKSAAEWHTMLVGGLRQGGSTYYALDVSNPDNTPGGAPLGRPYPNYMWEFPPENPGSALHSTYMPFMGETWGQPIITRIRVADTVTPGAVHDRWVVIVTAGYANTGNPNNALYDPNATAGRAILVLDAKTGNVLAEKKYTPAATDARADMDYAFASTPAAYDLDSDGYTDSIYVGDMGGQVFKWVIRDPASLTDPTQPSWNFRKFFAAPTATISGTTYYQNLFFQPAGTFVGGRLALAFGSGQRDNIAFPGVLGDDGENSRFYTVFDEDPYEVASPSLPVLGESNLVDVTGVNTSTSIPANKSGFFFIGADAEKFVTNSEIFGGYVFTASFTPEFTGDDCTSRGHATLYAFDVGTGGAYFTDAGGNPVRAIDIGAGLPTDPKTSVGPDGKSNRLYIEKSGTDLESFAVDDLNFNVRGLYWRETR